MHFHDLLPLLRWTGLALLVQAAASPCPAIARPGFTDVTAAVGLTYLQGAVRVPPNCIFHAGSCQLERMSGGAAVGDVDGDGQLDLYATRLDAPGLLFRNRGDGTFEDISFAANLDSFDLHSNGAAFADIDNDGDFDLYVTVLGDAGDPINNRNYLFVNDGRGVFAEEGQARHAALAGSELRRSFGVAFGDFDRDGWLDLHTTEWLRYAISHARLLRNFGPTSRGYYEDVTEMAGVGLNESMSFASAFTDLDDDGWPDLAVAGDFGTSRLFWNGGNGTFTNGAVSAGVGTEENGMGSSLGDFDGDGDLDWFVTSINDPTYVCEFPECDWGRSGNRLYRNEGNRIFSDVTDFAHVRDGGWGWGTAFLDYDNDADLDLVMTNGVDFPEYEEDDRFNADPMRLWENDGTGVMTEVAAEVGLTDTGSGKGLLVFDYDNDGDLDIFIVNNAGTPSLYRNDGGNANGWLRVSTLGSISNREGIGARVTLQSRDGGPTQVREIASVSHFLGQSERIAHFGLGPESAPVAHLIVKWPSGLIQSFTNVPRNITLVAEEPDPLRCEEPACEDGVLCAPRTICEPARPCIFQPPVLCPSCLTCDGLGICHSATCAPAATAVPTHVVTLVATQTPTILPSFTPESAPTPTDSRTPTRTATPTPTDAPRPTSPASTGCTVTVAAGTVTPTVSATPSTSFVPVRTATATAVASPHREECVGDCNRDGEVTVAELLRGVGISLGVRELEACPNFDVDGDGGVAVHEIIAAVNADLYGCRLPAPTPAGVSTATATVAAPLPTISLTATPAINLAPVIPPPGLYQAYPGEEIRLSIDATDPDGNNLRYTATNLPGGAMFDETAGLLRWTPREDQLGPFYIPFTCADDGAPPQTVQGMLIVQVSAADACIAPTCDPSTGCTSEPLPLAESCCGESPPERVAYAEAGCPEGAVLFVGRNNVGIGRLQDCDRLRVLTFAQAGAFVRFHVEARCLRNDQAVTLRARLETGSRLLFDDTRSVSLQAANGYAQHLAFAVPVLGPGPFFEFDGAEAQFHVTLTDVEGTVLEIRRRVVLTFDGLEDLEDPVAPPPH